MQSELFYPAVFTENDDNTYTVTFPDLEGAVTQGETLENSYKMATELLGMTLVYLNDEKRPIPEPSKPKDIKLATNQSIVIVEFNLTEYRKKYDSKAVSKNCTIPNWLNIQAVDAGINFSQVLQKGLIQELGIH